MILLCSRWRGPTQTAGSVMLMTVAIGDKDTLKYGYESGLNSLMRNVYERGVVIMPPDQLRAADFLSDDPEKVVMDLTEARSTAMTMSGGQPNRSRTTELKKNILPTAAAWIPLAHCGHHVDKLQERMPWLVALTYSLDLPYKICDILCMRKAVLELAVRSNLSL